MQNMLLLEAPAIAAGTPANVMRNIAHWHQQMSAHVTDERSRRRHRAARYALLHYARGGVW